MSGFRHNPPATPVTVKLELPCLLWMGWPRGLHGVPISMASA